MGGYGHGDYAGFFRFDTRDTDGTGQPFQLPFTQTFFTQSLHKSPVFGCRPDQADESEIIPAQQGFTQVLVELMAVSHDQAIRLPGQVIDFRDRVLREPRLYVGRQFLRKLPGATVYPGDAAGSGAGQGIHQGAAHVAGAEQYDLEIAR